MQCYLMPDISIHALREEGDALPGCASADQIGFLSTPSARRATERAAGMGKACAISIHALREEGDPPAALAAPGAGISIHALREEGDFRTCV